MKAALRKVQRLARQSVLSLGREQAKELPLVLSSVQRSLMRVALRKGQQLAQRSVLPPEWEQAKEQLRVPLLAVPRRKTKTNFARVGLAVVSLWHCSQRGAIFLAKECKGGRALPNAFQGRQ
jgi:hypothetical protein